MQQHSTASVCIDMQHVNNVHVSQLDTLQTKQMVAVELNGNKTNLRKNIHKNNILNMTSLCTKEDVCKK